MMKKIKNTFIYIGQFITNPVKKIAAIPISDKAIEFFNKHVWFRLLLAAVITAAIYLIYKFSPEIL